MPHQVPASRNYPLDRPAPHRYDAVAVEKMIAQDPRIKGKEAKMIHALLKGRH